MYLWASLRLIIITLVAITTLLGAVFGLRWIATLEDPPPPLLPQIWSSVTPWIMKPVGHPDELDSACAAQKYLIPVLEIRPSQDGDWFLASRDLEVAPESQSSQQLRAQGALTAEEAFKRCARAPLGIHVHSQESRGAQSIQSLIRKVGIKSPLVLNTHQSFLRAMRKLEPHWIYASDPSSYLRWKLMTALGLGPLATLDYDVFFIPLLQDRVPVTPLQLLKEAHRRNIPIVFEWDGQTQISNELKQWARGVYSRQPELARKLLTE